MKIIGVTGRKFSGKDTFAAGLPDFTVIKFADPLKGMLRSLFRSAGLDDATIERMIEGDLKEVETPILQGKTPRYAMQTLGTEWRDLLGNRLWLDIVTEAVKAAKAAGAPGVVITDLRFSHEEIEMRKWAAHLVRVIGSRAPNEHSAHPSETYIDEMPVDTEVFNFGAIDDLHAVAFSLADRVTSADI